MHSLRRNVISMGPREIKKKLYYEAAHEEILWHIGRGISGDWIFLGQTLTVNGTVRNRNKNTKLKICMDFLSQTTVLKYLLRRLQELLYSSCFSNKKLAFPLNRNNMENWSNFEPQNMSILPMRQGMERWILEETAIRHEQSFLHDV